jgi:hypothetical protein
VSQKRAVRYSSDVRLRSNTEAVISSKKHPRHCYHHFSPKKVTFDSPSISPFSKKEQQKVNDNN